MTETLTAPAQSHTCPACRHTERIDTIAAELDPDRLADRVRAILASGEPADDDALWIGPDRDLLVDVARGETWEGEWTRTADQQLHLALVHLAAALAAGAKL
ncbi:carnitine racemase [Mycobacteroides abscessus]|uniref:carnitine racemase n=1 Tax=Mycobacteroides abscessus TaxID=36809 RepID=UPI000929D606|nr:carnitine racemase [Mycobacteroides abscessus]SIJ94085.1 carnitine racemase, putative [Mycobacteroides abscessus subsp. abscessus]